MDAIAEYGDHPQNIVNRQLVDECDAMVAIFHSKLGTPTENDVSGTVEELNRVYAAGKPVAVFIYKGPIDHDKAGSEQFMKLRGFTQAIRSKGLHQGFTDPESFRSRWLLTANEFPRRITGRPSMPSTVSPDNAPNLAMDTLPASTSQAATPVVSADRLPSVEEMLRLITRSQQVWNALAASLSRDANVGMEILKAVSQELSLFASKRESSAFPDPDNVSLMLTRIATLREHRFFNDAPRALEDFWEGGLETLHLLALLFVGPATLDWRVTAQSGSKYEAKRRQAVIQITFSDDPVPTENGFRTTITIRNVGQYAARNLEGQIVVPGGVPVPLKLPASFDPGDHAEYFYVSPTLSGKLSTRGVIAQFHYEDGEGPHVEQIIL